MAFPTSGLSPAPDPQQKGVPVLVAYTGLRVLQAHSSPKPDTHLCSGDTAPRSPRQAVTRRGACRPLLAIVNGQGPSRREARLARGSPGGKPSDTVKTRKEGDVRLIKIAFCPD